MTQSVDIAILTVLPEEVKGLLHTPSDPRPAPSSDGRPNPYAWTLGKYPRRDAGDSCSSYEYASGLSI